MLIETGALVEGDDDGSSSLKITSHHRSKPGRGCILGQFEHKYSVSSAFWDPRGRKIVTTCYDNNLRKKLKLPQPIQKAHNCQTGR
ncbi:uncharacterized protein EI90DRAFT_3102825 [Cantharellus anzutake]|uniref:uncharacterized protein n=1 Tax=Cantharellus anzutake TaxID=1750568 RepID=UPI00190775C0|nr:uncharacterized protein EI90DRAFT_3102825 [Cantharellus anzutake]KAF8309952.1 hypothetical protein EI90DRAFT_3102825 [Cantharellus anzutake]